MIKGAGHDVLPERNICARRRISRHKRYSHASTSHQEQNDSGTSNAQRLVHFVRAESGPIVLKTGIVLARSRRPSWIGYAGPIARDSASVGRSFICQPGNECQHKLQENDDLADAIGGDHALARGLPLLVGHLCNTRIFPIRVEGTHAIRQVTYEAKTLS